ncbi:MAG: hypothetical protein GW809_08810 [Bacteroidetes bacterium]|nr:hypothetical protein [Bacteroidota bacterium]NCQ12221.1 hypothetical protein [Bacteroidota bacterium]
MAIAIKSIPPLKGKESTRFRKNAEEGLKKKSSVPFTKEQKIASAILAKSKL